MGFLKRFFSLQKKHKPQRAPLPDFGAKSGGVRRAVSEQVEYDDEDEEGLGDEEDTDGDMYEQPAPSSSYLKVPDADVARRARASGRSSSCSEEGEVDAAVARLLRSSSARFNVVTEADYLDLPPLPHPIDTVSSRSTSNLSLTPSRAASMRATTGSYRVTVHKRQQLSTTEFPNAYPPITPRRPGIAHTSTPNLLSIFSNPDASASTPALIDPRKVPITPRDANRLNRLRQDPSVASLLRMYDDDGRLGESAFANTPAVQRTRKRWSRRKSTFKELLGCEGAREADLLWAETCLAQQSVLTKGDSASIASTSSLSSTSTPPLDSPATSTFNDLEYEREVLTPAPLLGSVPSTGSDATATEKEDGFSSLVVELSVITTTTAGSINVNDQADPYIGPYLRLEPKERNSELSLEERSTADEDTTVDAERKNSTRSQVQVQSQESGKMVRKPSQRASQVFNFIAERRERRKSQELLQNSALPITNLSKEASRMVSTGETGLENSIGVKSDSVNSRASQSRQKSTVTLSTSDDREADPAPSPPSPVALRPLCPAPRPSQSRYKTSNASSGSNCAAGSGSGSGSGMVRASSSATAASTVTSVYTGALPPFSSISELHLPQSTSGPGKPAKGSTAALLLMQAEREKEKERRRAEIAAIHAQRVAQGERHGHFPQIVMSTPHPSKIARGNGKEKERRGRRHEPVMLGETTNVDGVAHGRKSKADKAIPLDEDFENRYNAFAESLDMRTRQLGEKENAVRGAPVPMQMQGRRRGAVDLGLARASTATFARPSSYKQALAPPAPTRSQSLSGFENPAPRSSAELVRESDMIMAEMYSRVRTRSGRGKQAANVV